MPAHVPFVNQSIVTFPVGVGDAGWPVTVTKSCTVAPAAAFVTTWCAALWMSVAVAEASFRTIADAPAVFCCSLVVQSLSGSTVQVLFQVIVAPSASRWSNRSTRTPAACAKLSGVANETPVPPAPAVPTAVATRVSGFGTVRVDRERLPDQQLGPLELHIRRPYRRGCRQLRNRREVEVARLNRVVRERASSRCSSRRAAGIRSRRCTDSSDRSRA